MSREGKYDGAFYRFDRAGNLLCRHDQRGALHLRWDANQRLIESRLDEIPTRYRYDPLGRRIEKRTGDRWTTFAWDGDALVGELIGDLAEPGSNTQSTAREWVYYPETFEPLAMLGGRREPNVILYYHNDPNGCPLRLFDLSGRTVWAARYGAWGRAIALEGDLRDNPLRLLGQYDDPESNLHYNRFRYYDPETGNFLSPDPLGLRAGNNLYRYAPNVWTWIDPLGLACRYDPNVRRWRGEDGRFVKLPNDPLRPHQQRPDRLQ